MPEKPLIDWFTVVAQVVNFLILVGLLKYFLYDLFDDNYPSPLATIRFPQPISGKT